MARSSLSARPFGIAAWAAPYLAGARLVLGTSAAAPLRLSELAELAGFDVDLLLLDDPPGCPSGRRADRSSCESGSPRVWTA